MGDYSKVVRQMQKVADTRDHPVPQTVVLTASDAHVVLEHIRWLGREREHLLDQLPGD